MFEKEAEEYTKERAKVLGINDCCLAYYAMQRAYQYGAEFGYKLAHEEMDYLNKHWGSKEETKANILKVKVKEY